MFSIGLSPLAVGAFLFFVFIIGGMVFVLSDNDEERKRIFEVMAAKRNGKVVSDKIVKLLVPFNDSHLGLFYEKRWSSSSNISGSKDLNRVSVVSFQFKSGLNEQFQIMMKRMGSQMAFGMMDQMIEDVNARTGLSFTRSSSIDDFLFMSQNQDFARSVLTEEVQASLRRIKDFQPIVTLKEGLFEVVASKRLKTETEWEGLLDCGQKLATRLCQML